ncbi:MAG: Crp/Fnr family transcriptional regulator [Desulfobacterales bacterium]|nr:Crp/Fnr family transcriptional regulator [Desulfobacterales bacterium]
MSNKLMAGFWKFMIGVPPVLWETQIEKGRRKIQKSLRFMTPDHRRVHHFVVKGLPRYGQPMPPEHIADALGLSREQVTRILGDLERQMTFLFRNPDGAVTWAYPGTVEPTPHRVTFSSGERIHGA